MPTPIKIIKKPRQIRFLRLLVAIPARAEISVKRHGGQIVVAQLMALLSRARLIEAARALTRDGGIAALRTEAVARNAGVAKGTLFAYFADRDGLALALISADLSAAADPLRADGPDDLAARLGPTRRLISGDRALFDLVQRHSGVTGPLGAPALEDWFLGLIADIEAHAAVQQADGTARRDVCARLLAEGAFAFLMQAAMFRLCGMLPDDDAALTRLRALLVAWLSPAARPADSTV